MELNSYFQKDDFALNQNHVMYCRILTYILKIIKVGKIMEIHYCVKCKFTARSQNDLFDSSNLYEY